MRLFNSEGDRNPPKISAWLIEFSNVCPNLILLWHGFFNGEVKLYTIIIWLTLLPTCILYHLLGSDLDISLPLDISVLQIHLIYGDLCLSFPASDTNPLNPNSHLLAMSPFQQGTIMFRLEILKAITATFDFLLKYSGVSDSETFTLVLSLRVHLCVSSVIVNSVSIHFYLFHSSISIFDHRNCKYHIKEVPNLPCSI